MDTTFPCSSMLSRARLVVSYKPEAVTLSYMRFYDTFGSISNLPSISCDKSGCADVLEMHSDLK